MSGEAPGLGEVLTHFTLSVPWLLALAAAAAWYARASHRAAGGPGPGHPAWRGLSFYGALVCVAIATVSPLEHYGNQALWINFLGFLVLTMVAPPLLLLGAPLTLAFRVSSPGMRRRLRRWYQGRLAAFLTFPVFTWLGFAAVTYLWQFTPLTEYAAEHRAVRDIQLSTLLVISLLFWQAALCVDPVRWRMAYPLRALYVFVEMTHKALFGGMFLSMTSTFHTKFGSAAAAWAPNPLDDQRFAILVLWIGGNMVFVAALIGIVIGWIRYEGRNALRTDRRLALQRAAAARRQAALEQVFGNRPQVPR